ncbi:hypothetical protein B0G73_112106 [Paraburkholderia sp. BL25I1N1]|nr:hypothetical protein B0G73_112106 [Paraburkholderia sp. BL25I1N1]
MTHTATSSTQSSMEPTEQSLKPLFFPPSDYWQSVRPVEHGRNERLPLPSEIVECHPSVDGWKGFATCNVCVTAWNNDYPGPSFRARHISTLSIIQKIKIGVTSTDHARRPIQATGYLFDHELTFIGLLDFRYFGEHLPRTIEFNVEELGLPLSTVVQLRFQLNGGGTLQVPTPPLVSSIFVEVYRCF